ncbi:hypothetical protein TWF481_011614 [Arthrobotrys musiformis]|uniref:Peptidase A1 domain-containing protein n=1 Tax=Arthrobotrys musiformis TaxID=47236 RepID=A0AAV9W0S1_9PEZI
MRFTSLRTIAWVIPFITLFLYSVVHAAWIPEVGSRWIGPPSRRASSATDYDIGFPVLSPGKIKRAEGKYVVLPTEYLYAELGHFSSRIITTMYFGTDRQPLNISVAVPGATWVPQRPESIYEFCIKTSCNYTSRSGYYTKGDRPVLGYAGYGDNSTTDGVWAYGEVVEDVVTGGGIQVDLQFIAATGWSSTEAPFLGLGLSFDVAYKLPYDQNAQRYSYISALFDQRKIGSKLCSMYNVIDTNFSGEVVLGGVNRQRFYGELDIYHQKSDYADQSYVMDHPRIQIGDVTDEAALVTLEDDPELIAKLSPLSPYSSFPSTIYDSVMNALKPFGLAKCSQQEFGVEFCIPCGTSIPENYVLRMNFKKAIIDMPFYDLIQDTPQAQNLCPVLITSRDSGPSYLGGPFFRAAYIVLDPEANRIAIAPSVRNSQASDIIELAAGSFSANLSTIVGVTQPEPSETADPSPTADPSASSDASQGNKDPLSTGALVGIGFGGAIALIAIAGGAFALFFIHRRKRGVTSNIPDMAYAPAPHNHPSELHPNERPPGELEVPKYPYPLSITSSPPSVFQELPIVEAAPPQELPGDLGSFVGNNTNSTK